MKIAKVELDPNQMINCFVLGLIPGFVVPVSVWFWRGVKETEVHDDFWLGVISSYGVAIVTAVALFIWLGTGIYSTTEEELEREENQRQELKTFYACHDDPVFGPPFREDGYPALEISTGSKGEGSFCLVKPPSWQPQLQFKIFVFHHTDGFHQRQRELYQELNNDFAAIWSSLYPFVNLAFQNEMGANSRLPEKVSLMGLKIGKDVPDKPLAYKLIIEYDQDEYADVWCVEERVTKVEFWM